jgi:hypothetical protein
MFAKTALVVLALALAANAYSLTQSDMARAKQPKPLSWSHVIGSTTHEIFDAMNDFLVKQPYHTQPCEQFTYDELNDLARTLWSFRSPELADIYSQANDNRQFHFDASRGLEHKEKLWMKENELASSNPSKYGAGSEHYEMVHEGKCAEIVMWWVHHLAEPARNILAGMVKVPLLPAGGLKEHVVDVEDPHSQSAKQEQIYQVTCASCHSTGGEKPHGAATGVGQRVSKVPVNGVPAGTCPIDSKTGNPSVWYTPMSDVGNRLKRCDWDFDPPCGLCEGIGGYSWGDQEDEISYIDCKPVALAKDIPKDNITTPTWPVAFQVEEVTTLINQISEGGQFPGADPCATHNFHNDTETFYYDDSRANFNGPIMYTKTTKTGIWTLPTADMFIKIMNVFCICVTPVENGNRSATPTGPLVHDFAKDAVLIGREIIGLEGLGMSVEADHWNKGPHHFWVSVATNRFVRGWQPWNGLNVYNPATWKIGPVDKDVFAVPKSCYGGLLHLHKNISCIHPYPGPNITY